MAMDRRKARVHRDSYALLLGNAKVIIIVSFIILKSIRVFKYIKMKGKSGKYEYYRINAVYFSMH